MNEINSVITGLTTFLQGTAVVVMVLALCVAGYAKMAENMDQSLKGKCLEISKGVLIGAFFIFGAASIADWIVGLVG